MDQLTRKLKFTINMLPCAKCGGQHAHWWSTSKLAPPSCEERIKRRG